MKDETITNIKEIKEEKKAELLGVFVYLLYKIVNYMKNSIKMLEFLFKMLLFYCSLNYFDGKHYYRLATLGTQRKRKIDDSLSCSIKGDKNEEELKKGVNIEAIETNFQYDITLIVFFIFIIIV